MQTPSAYKWTGPSGQVEFDTESECSAAAAAIGWTKEPLYTEAQMAAAVAAERERCALVCEQHPVLTEDIFPVEGYLNEVARFIRAG